MCGGSSITKPATIWTAQISNGFRRTFLWARLRRSSVWKLDRISRTIRDGLTTLCGWCDRGLRVVSVTQQIDFNGTIGKMIAAVLFGVAEMEQQNRRERQAAGIEAAKERGVYIGRLPGTTKGTPCRAIDLRKKGLTDGEIATAIGVSRRTVQRYLMASQVQARKSARR